MAALGRDGLRRLFRLPLRSRAAIDGDADEELASMFASRVEHLVARGLSPEAARDEALRRLGVSLDDARRQLHHSAAHRERRMSILEMVDSLAQDLRYAARGLAHRPAFTIVGILTLAIGIGATTAIFSAVDALLLRPLPYAQPDQLMRISLVTPPRGAHPGRDDMVWSYPKYVAFRDAQHAFSRIALFSGYPFTFTDGDVEQVRGEYVNSQYLRTLGLRPAAGRDFDSTLDAHPGAPRQAILSYALWSRRYDANPSLIGQTVDIAKQPYVVVGIAPQGFDGLSGQAAVFVPVTTRDAKDDLDQAFSHEFNLVGRRKADVSAAQAAAEVQTLGLRIARAFPDPFTHLAQWTAQARRIDDVRVSPVLRRSALVLFGAVGFVLLIACVNVAGLLLGRASARQREIAVRLAIGADRGRLVRLLVTESTLLALAGGLASVVVAALGVRALSAVNPAVTARLQTRGSLHAVAFADIHLDAAALAFTFGVALVAGILFGLVPALHATRSSLANALKEGANAGRRLGGVPNSRRLLVIAQVALALVLLAGSGLMLRSLGKLLSVDDGFNAEHLLSLRLSVIPGSTPRDSLPAFYDQLLERLRAVPGVTHAALTDCPPLNGGCNGTLAWFPDRPKVDEAQQPLVGLYWASPDLLATLGTRLVRGRTFATTDRVDGQKVVIINETAAKRLFPDRDPIGARLAVGQGGFGNDGAVVVGIAADVRQLADSAPQPSVYLPLAQSPRSGMMILLRTAGDPAAVTADARRAIREAAPGNPVYDVQTMAARTSVATAQARYGALLLALFALTALALSAIGVYGVLSLAVSSRTREIGIRIALGAEQARVRRLVIGEGVALAAVGAALGLVGAFFATRVLRTLLFDLTPSDPVTYVSIIAVLGAAVVAASWLPARRASKVDPVVALRAD